MLHNITSTWAEITTESDIVTVQNQGVESMICQKADDLPTDNKGFVLFGNDDPRGPSDISINLDGKTLYAKSNAGSTAFVQ